MIAAFKNNIEIANMLISAGANLNIQNDDEQTALMIAVFNDNIEIAEMLIKAGADVNIRDSDGDTALDYYEINDEKNKNKIFKIISQQTVGANLGEQMRNFRIPTLKELAYEKLKKYDTSALTHDQKIDMGILLTRLKDTKKVKPKRYSSENRRSRSRSRDKRSRSRSRDRKSRSRSRDRRGGKRTRRT